ncbi:MAG TPA: agmatine deiminase family protein [Pyrinomonadaceae bacterium]|jgi:agmatine deiminase|nr:agmatine deiminase family protein [Pyrinomonadaceae bacterium]
MDESQLQTPAALGYRMPAEWHAHHSTWLTWPKDPETWPDRVSQVEEIYLDMIGVLTPHELVNLLVDDEGTERTIRERISPATAARIRFHHLQTVDSWIRDYGPNFLLGQNGEGAFNDWIFNAWGNKYEALKKDDSVPRRLEAFLKLQRFSPGIVMEGGSIEVNGAGCVLTTEQCLLNPNRNPELSRKEIEQYLKDYLGVSKVLWLGEGIVGDDTDGHIDDIARFVAPNTIVCALEDDPEDANYQILQDNLARLRSMTDVEGNRFEIVTLPMPGIVGGTSTSTRELDRLPASYANFYIANNVVLAPVFGHSNDARAVEVLQNLFPTRQIVPINCEPLVWGMGTIHCVTQQQPEIRVIRG